MSATLVARGLAAGHGDRALFSGLDLVVAPGDVVGLVGANGAGKSTLLRMLAGLDRARAGRPSRLSPPHARPSATCRRSRSGAPGETVARLPRPAHRRRRRAGATGRGDRRRWPRASAGRRRRVRRRRWSAGSPSAAPTSTSGPSAVADDLGLAVRPRPADDRAVRRPGGPRRAWPRCCSAATTSSCSTSRPTTSTSTGSTGWRRSSPACGPASSSSATTASSSPARSTAVVELDLAQQQVTRLRRRLRRPTWTSARSPGGTRARTYEEYADTRRRARGAGPHAARLDGEGRRATPGARRTDNDKIGRKFRGEATEKQAAKARQTERLIERLDVVEEPRKEWELRMEIAAAPRAGAVVATLRGARRPARRLHPRPGRPADRLGRPGRDHRAERRGQVDPARGAARAGSPLDDGQRLARPGRRGRRGRPGPRRSFGGDEPLLRRVRRRRCPDWPAADVRTLLAKFGLRADHVLRPAATPVAGRADPRRAGAAAGARRQPARAGRADQPPRPARHRAARAALDTYPGTLLLVTHDRRMLDAVHVTRRLHVDDGTVTEVAQ